MYLLWQRKFIVFGSEEEWSRQRGRTKKKAKTEGGQPVRPYHEMMRLKIGFLYKIAMVDSVSWSTGKDSFGKEFE